MEQHILELILGLNDEIISLKKRVEELENQKSTPVRKKRNINKEDLKMKKEIDARIVAECAKLTGIPYEPTSDTLQATRGRVTDKVTEEEMINYMRWMWDRFRDDDFMSKHMHVAYLFQAKNFKRYYAQYKKEKTSIQKSNSGSGISSHDL